MVTGKITEEDTCSLFRYSLAQTSFFDMQVFFSTVTVFLGDYVVLFLVSSQLLRSAGDSVIAFSPVQDYDAKWDPTLVKSEKSGRGPLPKDGSHDGKQGQWSVSTLLFLHLWLV